MKYIPIRIDKGMWSSGDASLVPDGYCLSCRNMVVRPNRLEARSPFVYDSLMNTRGLASFDDQTNKVSRLIAIDSSQAYYEKNTSGDTWSTSKGTLSGTRLTDFCNYRGVQYGMMDDGAGVPTAAYSFDGTNLSTTPFSSSIQARCVTSFLDRIFLAYPRVTVTPLNPIAQCYQFENVSYWNGSNVAVSALTLSGKTVRRLYPQSTGAQCTIGSIASPNVPLTSNTSDAPFVARMSYRPVDASNTLPLTFSVKLFPTVVTTLTAYSVGDLMTANSGDGVYYRCTTAGTTAGVAPTYNSTLGNTTNDGSVVWTAVGNKILSSVETTVPTTANQQSWASLFLPVTVPAHNNTVFLGVVIGFYNSSVSLLSNLSPLDVSLADGLSDSNPAKQNYGFQLTSGEFYYPFVNTETAATSTRDLNSIVWSEVQQPKRIRASATYELPEIVGFPTAATTVGRRYLVFKRNAFWVFSGNQDLTSLDVIPIRVERAYKNVGCIGPRALDQIDDTLYFIGEDGVYQFRVGDDSPSEIGGNAMREELMNRGANWVESQSTYNMPLLKVNQRDREVWVYTQKGKIHVYRIDAKAWTTFDVANSAEIADFHFNTNTRKMYVAVGGFGLARYDWSISPQNDTVDNTATTYTVTKDIITRPVEMFAPRGDVIVDHVGIFHLASASQTGQTLTAYVTFDRGSTYPYSDPITLDLNSPRNRIYLYETAPSIAVKLSHVGKAGPTIWAVSKLDIAAVLLGGEWPQDAPTQGTASL